jgi:hypothetical protein
MDNQAFLTAYRAPRNGTDTFHFNPMYRRFKYSDGVKQCAEAGCYWLLDILGTELPGEFRSRTNASTCMVTVEVMDASAHITGEFVDEDPNPYRRSVDYTDMPEGQWNFYVSFDGDDYFCILISEY